MPSRRSRVLAIVGLILIILALIAIAVVFTRTS
jgi:hypothetical protein